MRFHRTCHSGFTLVELLTVLAIVGLLAALLFPVLASARAKSRETTCLSNLRQIGLAVIAYAEDNDERFPYGVDAFDLNMYKWDPTPLAMQLSQLAPLPVLLHPYIKNDAIWQCPADVGFHIGGLGNTAPLEAYPSLFEKYGNSYGYNTTLALNKSSMTDLEMWSSDPPFESRSGSQIVLLYDGSGKWHGGTTSEQARYCSLFVDGHVKCQGDDEITLAFHIVPKKPTP